MTQIKSSNISTEAQNDIAGLVDVSASIAGLSAGDIGTYCFARSTSDCAFGATRTGSSLYPTSAFTGLAGNFGTGTSSAGTALTGTWQAMAHYDYNFDDSHRGVALWLRIS